ncbi:MAG: ATP-binding protein [Bacilli bacterium]|nr:ATP-binding protein [Bacilli bacterium]
MKKKNVINLIKCFIENDREGFINEAYNIADDFEKNGDLELSQYIIGTISGKNVLTTQIIHPLSDKFTKVTDKNDDYRLFLPDIIKSDITDIMNVIEKGIGINKFLFVGPSGTGKTESIKILGRLTGRQIYSINFSSIIDSKLGQTQKNIEQVFAEINGYNGLNKTIFLLDEIDALALDRININDLREMGRVTSTLLKCLDFLNEKAIIFATTNLQSSIDKALKRRFDKIVDFNKYSKADLLNVAESILDYYIVKFNIREKNGQLFRKIISSMNPVLSPGELQNAIKTSLAFSNPNSKFDYLTKLYFNICKNATTNVFKLKKMNFTTREIEILTSISKSKVSNMIGGTAKNE